ncbi:MAG: hypothetical protein CFE32_21385, partial [Alphaproteobacteria bacterium PA3]
IHEARRAGLDVTGQVGAKSIGVLFGFETSRNPFDNHPAWLPLAPLKPRERYERLLDDPALRQRLVSERPTDALTAWFDQAFRRTFALGPALDYEPEASQSLAARTQREGTSPWALALDALMAETRSDWSKTPEDTSLLQALCNADSPLPPLRFDCGRDDPFIEANRQLHADLQSAGIAHAYAEHAGGHGWGYWAQHLEDTLRFFGGACMQRRTST